MITHIIPCAGAVSSLGCHGAGRAEIQALRPLFGRTPAIGQPPSARPSQGLHGPLRVALHVGSRLQGPGLDPGCLSARCWRATALRASTATRALDRPALDAGGNALLREIEALIARFPPYSEEREQFAAALYGTSEMFKIDSEGRVILSETLKLMRRSRDAVAFVGLGHKFQIWEPGRFRAELAEATEKVRALQEAAWLPGGGGRSAWGTGMMAGSGGREPAAAGGLARHIPVLGGPAVDHLAVRDGGIYIDAHLRRRRLYPAILAAADCRVLGIDRDQSAVARGFDLVEACRRAAGAGRGAVLRARRASRASFGLDAVDGVVLDLGVSSMQLDEAERGFSFRLDGPLDMRMGGERPERGRRRGRASRARSRRHHLRARRGAACARGRTRHRAGARRGADPTPRARWPRSSRRSCAPGPAMIHPATRTFQALRIFVNEELRRTGAALHAAEQVLRPGGRLSWCRFPFAGRPHRQVVPERTRSPRTGSRHLPEIAASGADIPGADAEAGRRRMRRKSPAIRAPVPPNCAPPNAPTRRPARRAARPAAAPAVARAISSEDGADDAASQYLRDRRASFWRPPMSTRSSSKPRARRKRRQGAA